MNPHQIFSKTDTSDSMTHTKSDIVAYQGGVHTVGVGVAILLLYNTNITANIHLNNATLTG